MAIKTGNAMVVSLRDSSVGRDIVFISALQGWAMWNGFSGIGTGW